MKSQKNSSSNGCSNPYKSILYAGRKWTWPADDTKLMAVNDWVRDVDAIHPYLEDTRTAVQAGGACGVWPAYLAPRFDTVITFEPHPVNFRCLVENNVRAENVICIQAALGAHRGVCALDNPPSEIGNCGTYYVKPGIAGNIPVMTIDEVCTSYDVDLIALDVEGFEIYALQGADLTITIHQPVIMLEDKELPQMAEIKTKKGDAVEYLKQVHDYKVVAEVHRDVIMVPK